jgi:dsDNA-binding SOS-regulon protein
MLLHKTSQERYEKLKREFHALMEHFSADGFDNFIATANSLRAWIEADVGLTSEQKEHLEHFVSIPSLDWQICNEIANRQKHPKRKRSGKAVIKDVKSTPDGGGLAMLPHMRIFGAGENISVEMEGRTESAVAVVIRVFRHFHYIFEVAPLPVAERSAAGNLEKVLST